MSVTIKDIPSGVGGDSAPRLPEAEMDRMVQVLNQHRRRDVSGTTSEPVDVRPPTSDQRA